MKKWLMSFNYFAFSPKNHYRKIYKYNLYYKYEVSTKMTNKIVLLCLVLLFCVGIVSATTCSPSSVTYNTDEPLTKTISCVGGDVNRTINIVKIGEYFTVSPTTIGSLEQKTITIQFNPPEQEGTYTGAIYFDDGYTVPVTINIQKQQEEGCNIDIFPTVLTNIKIKQGETKTRNIQLTVPTCFSNRVTIQGVALQTDEQPIQLGELQLGGVNPGESVIIPIEINAIDVPTGTYSDVLQFLLYDSKGMKLDVPSVTISVTVTRGVTPITNFSLSELPTCTLNAIEMNLNNTYMLTCTKTDPNIDIRPIIDTRYIKGISVEETSTQYIYKFQPLMIGETKVGAEFLYKNAPIGTPFEQDVRISLSGSTPVFGTYLKFLFYPELDMLVDGEKLTILVADNKTGNIVPDFKLYLNGVEMQNNTLIVEANKEYEIRATAPGYFDAVINFTVEPKQVKLILPGELYVGDSYNITVEPNNTIVKLNGVEIPTTNFIPTEAGVFTITAEAPGYKSVERNITIVEKLKVVSSPDHELEDKNNNFIKELVKGEIYKIKLNKNATIQVLFSPFNSDEIKVIANSTSSEISFKPTQKGYYYIDVGGERMKTYELTGFSLDIGSWFGRWWIVVVAVLALGVFLVYLRGKKTEGENYQLTFAPKVSSEE